MSLYSLDKLTKRPCTAKAIIVRLLKNLKRENQKGTPLISLNDPIERAHVYTGISKTALRSWINMDDTPAKTPDLEMSFLVREDTLPLQNKPS